MLRALLSSPGTWGLLCAACASSATPHEPTVPSPAPAVVPEVAPASAPESLLELVPDSAAAVVVMRDPLFELPQNTLRDNPELAAELGAYLRGQLGVDLSRVRGLVAYVLDPGQGAPDWAVVLRMDGKGTLKGVPIGRYRTRDIVRLQEDPLVYAAVVDHGLALGSPQGLTIAMDLSAGAVPALSERSRLAQLRDYPHAGVVMAVTFEDVSNRKGELADWIRQFGAQRATLALSAERLWLRVDGSDPDRLKAAQKMLEMLKATALAEARTRADDAKLAGDTMEAVGAIVGYHELRRMFAELGPRLEGSSLLVSYQMPELGMSMAALGVLGALAVPAFEAYQDRAASAQARATLSALSEALAEKHRQALADAGKNKRKRKRVLSDLRKLQVEATPLKVPCGDEVAWTEGERARLRALGFTPQDEATRYSYQVGSPQQLQATGPQAADAVLVLRARGDLDCDGEESRFDLYLGLDADGGLQPLGEVQSERSGE